MPWDVHGTTVNVTDSALSLADGLYMLFCAGSSAVYQTWACLGSRSSLPSSTLDREDCSVVTSHYITSTLAHDVRVISAELASRWLSEFRSVFENPLTVL